MGTTLRPVPAERTNLPGREREDDYHPADRVLGMDEPIGNDGLEADREEATPWPMRASPYG
jgi:hypothetical protein